MKKRLKQQNFFGDKFEMQKCFGGNIKQAKGNPKTQRPISTKNTLHLILRSSKAKGEFSFLKPKRARRIDLLARKLGSKLNVKVYAIANSGNHLHLIVLPHSRRAYKAYVRSLTGIIARLTLGLERKKAKVSGKKEKVTQDMSLEKKLSFWDARPFTRIINWGKDFKNACRYLEQNTLEAFGFIPYQPRRKYRPSG